LTDRPFKPRALGEIAIRCADMDAMVAFYRDVVGLEPLPHGESDGIFFFRIADGYAGHTAVLALFRHDAGRPDLHPTGAAKPATGAGSSLHHFALSLGFDEQTQAIAWFDANAIPYRIERFDWVGWRGVFLRDPEGNTVELVAFDERMRTPPD